METISSYTSLAHYCNKHDLSEVYLGMFLNMVVFRLEQPFWIDRDIKLINELVQEHEEVMIGSLPTPDYQAKLLEAAQDADTLLSNISQLQDKFPHAQDLFLMTAKQHHLYRLFEVIHYSDYYPDMIVNDCFDPEKMQAFSHEAWLSTASLIEAMIDIIANHDNILAQFTGRDDVGSLMNMAQTYERVLGSIYLIETIHKKLGLKGIKLMASFSQKNFRLARTAIEAYSLMKKEKPE